MKLLIIFAALKACAGRLSVEEQTALNPIRKVVTLLQKMQIKVEEEREVEAKLFDEFMCYCKKGSGDLQASIASAEEKLSTLPTEITAAAEKLTQLKTDVKQAQSDRSSAKSAMAKATSIRETGAAAYASEKAEYDSTIQATAQAVAAMEQGVGGGFLQTGSAQALRDFVHNDADIADADREALTSFLSASDASHYVPRSGQIIGILKQMGDTVAADLLEATQAEELAIKSYKELMTAKKLEVDALIAAIERKLQHIGELGIDIVEMKEDLSDTEVSSRADRDFLANLSKGCATKQEEWDERSKTRAEELVALADTIKVLNDDDALDLFKKTLPGASASLVQTRVSMESLRNRALVVIKRVWAESLFHRRVGIDLLVLALTGKKGLTQGVFLKTIKMITDMVAELKKEQQVDSDKKEYCAVQMDTTDDKKKGLERTLSDLEGQIAKAKDGLASLTDEIVTLTAGIVELDQSVAEATEQRKSEHLEFKALMAADAAAKDVLAFAKNRLNKFYNPSLYVAPPKRELSASDRIYENMGGDLTTAAPGGIANTGIAVLAQVKNRGRLAPPPPPNTWEVYSKKTEESTGVISMIDLLIKDLDQEMTEAKAEETDGQADYERLMKDSAAKRVADSKSLTSKQAAKADTESALAAMSVVRRDTRQEMLATLKYIQSLHIDCDWLIKYYDVREQARTGEIDSLVKAKAVLSGADYSLLQVDNNHGFLIRSH